MQELLNQNMKEQINGIIIDSTDFDSNEESISSQLFQVPFYEKIFELLDRDAIFSQNISEPEHIAVFEERVRKAGFKKIDIKNAETTEYGSPTPLAIC